MFYPVKIVNFSNIFVNSLRDEGHFEAWRAIF
jgi:hypothetical protein